MLSLIRIKQTTHSMRCSAAHGSRVAAKPGHVVYVHDPPSYLDQSTCDQNMENAGKMLLRQIELRCDHAFLRGQCDHRLLGLRELWQLTQQVTADALSPGAQPTSEPETTALLSLLDRLHPRAVVSLHAALACIDDAGGSHLGRQLAGRCALPLLTEIGYATPGSMGTWATEQGLTLVTWELEAASLYDLKDRHVPILIDLMTGRIALEA